MGVGQDKLLHRLKFDTNEETNHLTELSYNKCTRLNYLGYLGHLNDFLVDNKHSVPLVASFD